MLGHLSWNAFVLSPLINRFLNDQACRCAIARNCSITQVLKDVRVTMKSTHLSHRHVDEDPINSRWCTNDATD